MFLESAVGVDFLGQNECTLANFHKFKCMVLKIFTDVCTNSKFSFEEKKRSDVSSMFHISPTRGVDPDITFLSETALK